MRGFDMHDLTLNRRPRGKAAGQDHSANLTEEQLICSIPHCNQIRADRVSIHLCEHHIQKAWAAYQILNGAEVVEKEDPDRDLYSLQARGTVYVIRVGDLFKIGWTSNPQQRMKNLKPDAVLHYRHGTRHDEIKLQARCVDHLAKGREWFHANDQMTKIVKEFQAGKAV